ncbi:hypothetical protein MAIT1_01683 [Magnetofaba australis IT-1]|uniref:Uncharacterized protein n=1 Tax=Magnetofaba australis IT-1 TaxID=1434232 RepID=A0A1Y2K231_9PROT|nr:hypothetical protein MAIT1_01683 [Magnetofaba australis IT-1]
MGDGRVYPVVNIRQRTLGRYKISRATPSSSQDQKPNRGAPPHIFGYGFACGRWGRGPQTPKKSAINVRFFQFYIFV